MWFSSENNSLKGMVLSAVNALERKHGPGCRIISPLCVLSIFEYAFQKKTTDKTVSNKVFEEVLLKTVLAFNQEFNERDSEVLDSISHIKAESRLRMPALALTTAMINSDLTNYISSDLLIAQFVKACYLFEFLESTSQMEHLLSEFLKLYKVSTWKEYLQMYLPIAFACFKKEKEAHVDIRVDPNEPDFNKICDFIETLILQNSQALSNTDFLSLRDQPMYKVSRGHYRVIFIPFLMEKIFQSLYFTLSKINDGLLKNQKIKDFRSFYGSEFSEEALVYKILDKCFPKSFIKLTGEEMRKSGMVGEPDYYVRFKNKIFLFEAKDTLLNAKVKHSSDFKVLEGALIEKFYKNKKGKPKAVLQLIDNIRTILEGNFTADSAIKTDSVSIFPILLVHYPQYNTIGLNRIVNMWFQEERDKLASEGLDVSRVKNLVIVDLDTFILHQELLLSRQPKALLDNALEDYSKLMDLKTSKMISFKYQAYKLVNSSVLSFSFYYSRLVDNKTKRKAPRILREKGLSLFEDD
jgi:hypothetical protein